MSKEKKLARISVSDETLISINEFESKLIALFKDKFDTHLSNDLESIKYLSDFINECVNELEPEDEDAWCQLIGSFFGQTIMKILGGRWVETELSNVCMELRDTSICFPFDKVNKQFKNGEEDSIYIYFIFITKMLNDQLPSS